MYIKSYRILSILNKGAVTPGRHERAFLVTRISSKRFKFHVPRFRFETGISAIRNELLET